ncbi:MAG: cupin domain-containing protein [Candidatus Sumerlaeaceae bacterium]|nr:cupin domain-containing protein [Candidatus Sumerlaeaceae bacterium]
MPLKKIADHIAFRDDKLGKVNLFETPRFFCDLYCLKSGQSQHPHTHGAEDKIYQVISGRVIFADGELEIAGEPGDLVHCPAGALHGVRNDSEEDAVLLVFMAPHPGANRFPAS